MRRFIIDNDGTNLFGRDPLTRDDLVWTVAQLPPAVTTVLLCPNWIGKFFCPGVGEPAWDGRCPGLQRAWDEGWDPFGEQLALIRESRREAFVTYRMNDCHNASEPDHPGASAFKRAHMDWTVDPATVAAGARNVMAYALDYSRPEVREYFLARIREIAEKYDVDGFQLDWMRFPRHLSGTTGGERWAKRDALTEFTADVRSMLDDIGDTRGRRIALGARVPTTPEGCWSMGADIAEWGAEELLDFISPAPFLSTDFYIPIGSFREMLPAKLQILPGADISYSGRIHHPESYAAWALAMHDLGADGLNLFNFPCWTERVAEHPVHWIADLMDFEALERRPLLIPAIDRRYRIEDIDMPVPLPADISPGSPADLELYIPSIRPPARANLLLAGEEGFDATVTVNGAPLDRPRFTQTTNLFPMYIDPAHWEREPAVADCRLFYVAPDILRPGVNTITVAGAGTLTRCDLGLWPAWE